MLTLNRSSDGASTTSRAQAPALGANKPRAVVIGSGFGGLAAAIRLGARGYAVTLLERLDELGGRARVHRIDGHVFDAGPTIVTAPFLFDELWELCGARREDDVELRALDPFYRLVFDDGMTFDSGPNPDAVKAEIAKFSQKDADGYDAYMRVSEQMYFSGFEKLADRPFSNVWDMAAVLPDLARLRADRSIFQLARRHFSDPHLQLAFSFHPLFVGGNPLTATCFYSMVSHLEKGWGVNFAMGGTGSLVTGMAKLLDKIGVEVRTGADVAEIEVEGGAVSGVRLSTGERLPAHVVVSNADSAWTYSRMVAPSARRVWTDRKVDSKSYSMSLFVWYFGTNRRYDDVLHHTIVLGPRYEELLRDIFKRKHLAKDFSLYLHRPTATDPSMAPPGCDAFYVLSPVPNLKSGTDWAAEAEGYRQSIADRLSETVLPGLNEALTVSHVATPQTFRDDFLSHEGAAFGMEPLLLQMAWFRPHNKSEDVKHLYLVGAGTHPGAGLPGVLCSAKVADALAPEAAAFV